MNIDETLTSEYSVFKLILDKIDISIMIINKEGIVVYYNEAAGRVDGLRATDVIGKHLSNVYPQFKESTLLQVQETNTPVINEAQEYKTWHGKTVNILCSTFPLTYKGELIGSVDMSRDITQIKKLSEQNIDLKEQLLHAKKGDKHVRDTGARYCFDDIVTSDQALNNLKDVAKRISVSSSPVLIYGETGTGKELFAQSIHNHSNVKGHFIAQNCAALPSTLLESILFGTVKGSFTGSEERQGLIELANNGTLFLDEINSMPLELQAKLLRFLQEGSFRRVGGLKTKRVKVRIIACTNINPEEAVQQKQLRGDLYYRLNVIYLEIPPLRKRKHDIVMLTNFFISKLNKEMGFSIQGVDDRVMEILESHHWPGNVRELEHCIEHAINVSKERRIGVQDLPLSVLRGSPAKGFELLNFDDSLKSKTLECCLREKEKKIIVEMLRSCDGNISKTAERLGMPRQTLHYRLKVLGITIRKSF